MYDTQSYIILTTTQITGPFPTYFFSFMDRHFCQVCIILYYFIDIIASKATLDLKQLLGYVPNSLRSKLKFKPLSESSANIHCFDINSFNRFLFLFVYLFLL